MYYVSFFSHRARKKNSSELLLAIFLFFALESERKFPFLASYETAWNGLQRLALKQWAFSQWGQVILNLHVPIIFTR